MSIPEQIPAAIRPFSALLCLLLSAALPLPAPAQQVLIGQSDTVRVTNGGVWHLQGATMDFGGPDTTAALVETDSARVTGGLLTATRTLDNPSGADPAGLGAIISASANLGDVTVTRGHTVQTDGSGNESIERYFDLSASKNNSGLDATLSLHYKDGELNNIAESDLEMFKSDDEGSTWSEEGFDSRDASANTVTLSGIESFSRWTLGSESAPLPVELARFEGTRTERSAGAAARLTWKTASETNNAGFAVQRRVVGARPGPDGGRDWTKVGFVESNASDGTSTEPQTYRFTDADLPYAADTLAYRLRQVDTDGSATLTDPVRVGRSGVTALRLEKTAPNPARSQVTVHFAVPEGAADEAVRLRLYDVLGRVVRTVGVGTGPGRAERQLSVEGLASGPYFLRLRAGDQTRTRRLTVVR